MSWNGLREVAVRLYATLLAAYLSAGLRKIASPAVRAPPWPPLPPAGNDLIELGFLDRGHLPGAVIDVLGVQPHAERPFSLVLGLVVPRPVVPGSQVSGHLAQALLPPGLINGLFH